MTKKQRQEHLDRIRAVLTENGWVIDRWDNYKKTLSGRVYRIKIQKTSMRVERATNSASGCRWVNLVSDYFKNVTFKGISLVIKGRIIK